jgi:predicted RNA polymerase sigma factor
VAARVDVDAALASLPVEFRTAVVLRDVCDLPYDEIAVILDVPVGTVRSRIARARSALAATWRTEADPTPESVPDQLGLGSAGNRAPSPHVRTSDGEKEERTQ